MVLVSHGRMCSIVTTSTSLSFRYVQGEVFGSSTSTSSSSITCSTTPSDSMKPLTATRSMRLVVARYCVRRTVCDASSVPVPSTWDCALGLVRQKSRRTSGDSSASTCRARSADEASRCVGRGMSMVLTSGQKVSTREVAGRVSVQSAGELVGRHCSGWDVNRIVRDLVA